MALHLPYNRRGAVLKALVAWAAAALLVLAAGNSSDLRRPSMVVAAALACVLAVVVTGTVFFRRGSGLTLDGQGLTFEVGRVRRSFRWSEIEAVAPRSFGFGVTSTAITLRDGRDSVTLPTGLLKGGTARTLEAIEATVPAGESTRVDRR